MSLPFPQVGLKKTILAVLLEFVEVTKSYSQGEEGGCVLKWACNNPHTHTHTHTHTSHTAEPHITVFFLSISSKGLVTGGGLISGVK